MSGIISSPDYWVEYITFLVASGISLAQIRDFFTSEVFMTATVGSCSTAVSAKSWPAAAPRRRTPAMRKSRISSVPRLHGLTACVYGTLHVLVADQIRSRIHINRQAGANLSDSLQVPPMQQCARHAGFCSEGRGRQSVRCHAGSPVPEVARLGSIGRGNVVRVLNGIIVACGCGIRGVIGERFRIGVIRIESQSPAEPAAPRSGSGPGSLAAGKDCQSRSG